MKRKRDSMVLQFVDVEATVANEEEEDDDDDDDDLGSGAFTVT